MIRDSARCAGAMLAFRMAVDFSQSAAAAASARAPIGRVAAASPIGRHYLATLFLARR